MPELHFKGKEFVFNHHLGVPYRPLQPDASKSVGGAALDGNLIVQGDNLHALKALTPLYAGKVDCVVIDPPYNTGNEKWSYNDNVSSPIIQAWLSTNPVDKEDMLRHDKWCCLMYPRLRLLHDLLAEDGVMYVCIGDDEVHRLRAMLDEIFGEASFLASFVWKSRAKPSNIGDAKVNPQNDAEYIIAYEKTPGASRFNLVGSGFVRSYPHEDVDGKYRLQTILKSNRGENERETMRFEIAGYRPPEGQRWQGGEGLIQSLYDTNRLEFREGTPFRKYYEHEEPAEHSPYYCFVERDVSSTAEQGKVRLNEIMGNNHGFDTVKPLEVIEYLIRHSTKSDALIIDSFAGSGTTGHAVLSVNGKFDGSRKFILVECEAYADSLTAERMRRVIQGYAFEGTTKEELLSTKISFTSLKKADKLLEQVQGIENLEGHRFDKITKKIENDTLTVVGEKKVTEKVEGLGGSFTYCTLGEPLDLDKLLTGEALPDYLSLGSWLFHTATMAALEPAKVNEAEWYLGESSQYHVWLVYRPELEFLKSRDAALTLSLAQKIAAAKTGKKHLVFAAAKFVPNKDLLPMGVEFSPLPFALYRVEK